MKHDKAIHDALAQLKTHPHGSPARMEAIFDTVQTWVEESITEARALGATDAMLAPFIERRAEILSMKETIVAGM